jgi:hypothetical protein
MFAVCSLKPPGTSAESPGSDSDETTSSDSTSTQHSDGGSASDEGVSDDEVYDSGQQTSDMSLTQLDTLFNPIKGDLSKYAANGISTKRIRKVVVSGGRKSCRCKAKCCKKLCVKRLQGTCNAFWRLSKEAQDAVLWSLGKTSSSNRRHWKLDGQPACRHGFCRALGIGRNRLQRVSKTFRGKDMRGWGMHNR